MRTGTIVVLILLGIGVVGGLSVQRWLRRPGGKESREAGAAYRQLREIGAVLQRYYRNHQTFPRTLDLLVRETDPVTRAPYLSAEMLENPWKAQLVLDPSPPERAVVRSKGPAVHLVLTVEKGDRFSVEEAK
ncbi:MAG: hypothetical protein AAB434_11655 [Planctomycetota bacterium]